jgi:hypothetical protein
VYYGKNANINQGTYNIFVGRGGRTVTHGGGLYTHYNGFSTQGFGAIINGGQSANISYNNNNDNNNNIASSAGALKIDYALSYGVINNVTNSTVPNAFNNIESSFIWNGNIGGKHTLSSETISQQLSYQAGGGGGAGTSAKVNYYNSGGAEADGGDGVLVDILGVDLYWGGGGGGTGYNTVPGNGGLGGGGSGYGSIMTGTSYESRNSFYRPDKNLSVDEIGIDAAPHTGGGGGGGISTSRIYSVGGSGIIIIKYLSSSSSTDIELVNGVTYDNNINYKIGNYNNIFKITSFKNEINTDNLVIDSNGNVGIGTLPPSYRLEVSECLTTTKRGALDLNISNKHIGISSIGILDKSFNLYSIINICTRFNGSIWITGECLFALNSDIRIKEDIRDINDDSALQKILAIEPKTYTYIDKIENGNKKVYGFIAQQVHKVIPEAVSLENAYIPNIMILADYNKEVITLPYIPDKVVIKIKDKIKCYDSENKLIEVEVYEIINEVSFKIKDLDKEYTSNKIFVYGTYIDDFHTLFKDHIFALNIGATQELYRQIIKQKDIIKLQEDRMGRLERENDELENKFKNLLKELGVMKE